MPIVVCPILKAIFSHILVFGHFESRSQADSPVFKLDMGSKFEEIILRSAKVSGHLIKGILSFITSF